jgi:hypothetical protein
VSADPLPNAAASRTNPALTQALSLLRRSDNAPALVQQWSRVTGTPLLRALLTQTGLTQVLQYDLGGKLLTALSREGLSRYLSTYRTAQVLNTISQTHPELATEAGALRTQVLGVLAARREALAPIGTLTAAGTRPRTLTTQARRPTRQNVDLPMGVQHLQHAKTPKQRRLALQQLQAQVTRLNATLTATRAGQLEQHQQIYNLALGQLQQMQAWLSDPQRLQEASHMSQVLWQGTVAVAAAIAGAAWGGLQRLLQPERL